MLTTQNCFDDLDESTLDLGTLTAAARTLRILASYEFPVDPTDMRNLAMRLEQLSSRLSRDSVLTYSQTL